MSTPPAARAARAILAAYGSQLAPEAVHLITPVPSTVPLAKLKIDPELVDFIRAYEPRTAAGGVYGHQAKVLAALGGDAQSVVLTTATGSGKSLSFWAWAFDRLRRDERATILACFPTQALLWGQADRLRRLSSAKSVVKRSEQAFAGVLDVAGQRIPWSVWYGVSACEDMKAHESSESFENARIRVCTLDKAHWSLMRKEHASFLGNLAGIITDEGHIWQGVSGAHVRRMFDRLRVSMEVLRRPTPAFFVASATLPDARHFASLLTGEDEKRFLAIDDGEAPKHATVPTAKVPELLEKATGEPGLHRFVLLVGPNPRVVSEELLADPAIMGTDTAALCFVQSKFGGHRLADSLCRQMKDRRAVAYDADMTARDRRKIEREFQEGQRGVTYVATSALEVGVDLPALDLVVMDELPPRRSDLLQRLGRVGRSSERPGLGVLLLGAGPAEQRLSEHPESLVDASTRPASLPLHLDALRLKAIKACRVEWTGRLGRAGAKEIFAQALQSHLGEAPSEEELEARIARELEGLVDLDDGAWYYRGFRASASQGKIPLVLDGPHGQRVAQIQDVALFRDAHPEAVYLGHRGERFRVIRYKGQFTLAQWTHPQSEVVLGKFMHQLREIVVEPVAARVTTRGVWVDRFTLYERKDLPPEADEPTMGALEYGVWDFRRRFDGYREIDLSRGGKVTRVTLAAVSGRFRQAMEDGASFPFLHDFTYRTLGWQWQLTRVLQSAEQRETLAPVLEALLHSWLCDAVECAPGDLQVELSAEEATLRVVDTTPGGNGLAAALLGGRMAAALGAAHNAVAKIAGEGALQAWLLAEHSLDVAVEPKEIVDALAKLESPWRTAGPRSSQA